MTRRLSLWFMVLACGLGWGAAPVWAKAYHLDIARGVVTISGKPVNKITVNGGIPGPVLRFTEGDEATITVTNHLNEDTSVHWHGLLLPGAMDGVPGFNGFPGIAPGETFTYHFPLRQAGTYWYHAHSLGQEQDGLYGALVVTPRTPDPVKADRDYVVLLSDFHHEDAASIMSHLKMSSDYYQYARRTLGDFWADVKKDGFHTAWQNAKTWGQMRMLPTDLSDVTGYTFLVNGQTAAQNWTGLFTPGERVRLRIINASAMTFYDLRIPGLPLQVVAADGQNVEPVTVDEFRFGPAETYDVIVTPLGDKAYSIAAESIDRTGFALATLAPQEGMRGEAPAPRPRALLTLADMGMNHGSGHNGMAMDHATMGHTMAGMDHGDRPTPSGWAIAGTPADAKALAYADLRYLGTQPKAQPARYDLAVTLGGTMERYIWTMNGHKFADATPITLRHGDRLRLTFINNTMMAHPMHLHGMFMQLDNGQPPAKMPNKHTVIVPPGQSVSVLLTADEAGEWAFHCHLLYHMMAGMMTKLVVSHTPSPEATSIPTSGGTTHALH